MIAPQRKLELYRQLHEKVKVDAEIFWLSKPDPTPQDMQKRAAALVASFRVGLSDEEARWITSWAFDQPPIKPKGKRANIAKAQRFGKELVARAWPKIREYVDRNDPMGLVEFLDAYPRHIRDAIDASDAQSVIHRCLIGEKVKREIDRPEMQKAMYAPGSAAKHTPSGIGPVTSTNRSSFPYDVKPPAMVPLGPNGERPEGFKPKIMPADISEAYEWRHLLTKDLYNPRGLALFQEMAEQVCLSRDGHITEKSVRLLIHGYERSMKSNSLYCVAEPFCEFLEAAAVQLPDFTISSDMLPRKEGVVFFSKPTTFALDAAQDAGILWGIAWNKSYTWDSRPKENAPRRTSAMLERELDPEKLPQDRGGHVIDYLTLYILATTQKSGRPRRPWCVGITELRCGDTYDYIKKYWTKVDDETEPLGETRSLWSPLDDVTLRLIAAFGLFIRQKILVEEEAQPNRAARRRVEQETGGDPNKFAKESTVRTVLLRHKYRVHKDGTPVQSEPSGRRYDKCRWLVSGFWRQQVCGPGRSERRPTWVAPFVKGPQNAPMKLAKDTIYKVAR